MQFSDTSTRQGLIQDCEDNTGLGSTGISGNTALLQQFTRYINNWYHKAVTVILESQDSWDFDDTNKTDYAIATTPLVANQRDYTFPSSLKILKFKRADITYDGTNWYRMTPFDSGAYGQSLGNDTTVDGRFSTTNPFYDVKANSIWIYPRATASTGTLRVEFFREVTEFTTASTTAEPGFDEPWHRYLSLGASWDYLALNGDASRADRLFLKLQEMEVAMRRYQGKKTTDSSLQLTSAYGDSYGS